MPGPTLSIRKEEPDGREELRAYLRDQLHIAVLDTVMNHLNIMAGALVANPVAAWFSVTLRSYGLEDILDIRPGLFVTSRHQTGTVTGSLFSTRYACANKTEAFLFQSFGSSVGVGEMRIAAVDDDIAGFYERQEGVDEIVYGLPSHD